MSRRSTIPRTVGVIGAGKACDCDGISIASKLAWFDATMEGQAFRAGERVFWRFL